MRVRVRVRVSPCSTAARSVKVAAAVSRVYALS